MAKWSHSVYNVPVLVPMLVPEQGNHKISYIGRHTGSLWT